MMSIGNMSMLLHPRRVVCRIGCILHCQFHCAGSQLTRGRSIMRRSVPESFAVTDQFSQSQVTLQSPLIKPPTLQEEISSSLAAGEQIILPKGENAVGEICKCISTMDASTLVDFIHSAHDQLDKVHFALALKCLHRIYRRLDKLEKPAFTDKLSQDQGFQVLCAYLALKSRYYEPAIAADMLKFLCILGTPSSHPTAQVYLQLGHHFINDITLDQLVQLAFIISKLTATDQTRSLMSGLKHLVPQRISSGLMTLSLWELITLLEFFGPALDKQTVKTVLRNICDAEEQIGWKYSIFILCALCNIGLEMTYLEELCQQQITKNIDKLSLEEMRSVINSCKELGIFNSMLFSSISSQVIDYKGSWQIKWDITKCLHRQSFFCKSLTIYIVSSVKNNLSEIGASDLVNFVTLLADVDSTWETMDWKNLITCIEKHMDFYTTDEKIALLLSLTVCGCHSELLAGNLLNKQSLQDITTRNQEDPYHKRTLHVLQLLSSSLDPSPIKNFKELVETTTSSYSILQSAVDYIVGKPQNVIHNFKTKHRLCIDHLVQLEDGEFKAVVTSYQKSTPCSTDTDNQDHQRQCSVAVLVFPGSDFHCNTGQLKAIPQHYCQLIQADGYLVTVINESALSRMEESDVIPHLKRKILNASHTQDLRMFGADNPK